MEKRVIVQQVEVIRGGGVQIKLQKQVIDENGVVFANEPHRCAISANSDFDELVSVVNSHLVSMGWPALATSEWNAAKQVFLQSSSMNL